MNAPKLLCSLALAALLAPISLSAPAQEMVPVPKSRLEELERAEQELRQLKGEMAHTNDLAVRTNEMALRTNKLVIRTNEFAVHTNQVAVGTNNLVVQSNNLAVAPHAVAVTTVTPREDEIGMLKQELSRAQEQNVQLQKQHEADAAKVASALAAEPLIIHDSPPMVSLPPLQSGDTVDAMDLANYYRADPATADQRYRNRSFLVRGEVARFEKTLFSREYRIILKTADREIKVTCSVFPPETYKAVFTVNDGAEMVGLTPREARVPLAKVGQTVLIGGQCKGLRNSQVTIAGCELKAEK
jgi:hypothetical protein